MTEPEADSPLAELRKKLYSPTPVDGIAPESSFAPLRGKQPEGWKQDVPASARRRLIPKLSPTATFLVFAVGFFALAGIVAAVVLFMGGRSVSADHLSIAVEGPTTISGGEVVPLLITVTNRNPLTTKGATLDLQFPQGTLDADNASVPLTHMTIELGDIPSGASVRKTARAAFYGGENQVISVPMTVEYTTENSKATFVSKDKYEFVIATSPISLTISTLSQVPSGQPLSVTVSVRSNAVAPLPNVAVRANYPFGFIPTSSSPTETDGLFLLGTLAPGEEREIRITGSLSGQEGEERVFRFSAGALAGSGAEEFAVAYSSRDASVDIAKPFLNVALRLNREEANTLIVPAGAQIDSLVSWENALLTTVLDGSISVSLSGNALDPESVRATNGFYRSADRTILFNRETVAGLASLAPGDSGNGSFIFASKTGSAMDLLRNPTINVSVSVAGRRVGEDKVPETVTSTLSRTIKIQTDLAVSARSLRTIGPFSNTGPVPPAPDMPSTYTVQLIASNSVNSVANASARMTLPSYVRFTGQSNPASSVKYNETTRELSWVIGDMTAGATRTAAFQVELLPSSSQKGTSPALTSSVIVSGFDRFVQQDVTTTYAAPTTDFLTDPTYAPGDGAVK